MKILIIIDEWGWAFEFFARGWKKYSKNEVSIWKYSDINQAVVDSHDAVFAMSAVVLAQMGSRASIPARKLVIGIRSQYMREMPNGNPCVAFVANSEAAYQTAISCGADKSRLHYIKGAVDGNIFTYHDVSDKKIVGWAGNQEHAVKRVHLMKDIANEYGGVRKKSNWGPATFLPGKNRDEQLNWLRTIGCYLQTSSQEGLSQALVEAFACGVPVVATPAGDTGKLLNGEWLIPINPESECINEANRKISTLFVDRDLARHVGMENRKKFDEEGWCWSKRVVEYDAIMENLIGRF